MTPPTLAEPLLDRLRISLEMADMAGLKVLPLSRHICGELLHVLTRLQAAGPALEAGAASCGFCAGAHPNSPVERQLVRHAATLRALATATGLIHREGE